MKFFATCATLEELRKVYRRLAVQYHPGLPHRMDIEKAKWEK